MPSIALFLSLLLVSLALPANAEKYYTWVDEMGRVHHTIIPEENNPLIKNDIEDNVTGANASEKVVETVSQSKNTNLKNTETVDSVDSTVNGPVGGLTSDHVDNNTDRTAVNVQKSPVANIQESSSTPQSGATSERSGGANVSSRRKPEDFPAPKDIPVNKHVEIDEQDYIDGDVLEKQGYVRDDNDLPYYTWTDEQGRIRNTYYRPEPSNSSEAKQGSVDKKAKPTKQPIKYTVAEQYRRVSSDDNTSKHEGVDDFAQQLFFNGQDHSFIEAFEERCCADLPKTNSFTLDFEDSIYIEIDRESENYPFAEGESPFSLIRLPSNPKDYALELKTFIKSSSKRGIKRGVFIPQMVMLNDQFEVVRIIRNPSLEFKPENWYRHGYLKGIFDIGITSGERYLLINTTRENLASKSTIESEKTVVLNPQKLGSFEISAKRLQY